MKFVAELPHGERFVAMTTCQGRVYIATERQVFVIFEDIANDTMRLMPIDAAFAQETKKE